MTALQAAPCSLRLSRPAAWHAAPRARQRPIVQPRHAALPAGPLSATSMPAEGSGGDPAAVTVPHGAEPAAAASGEPTVERVEGTAAAAAEPGGSGPLAWLLRRRQRTKAEWHRRVGSLGLSAVLAYGERACSGLASPLLIPSLAGAHAWELLYAWRLHSPVATQGEHADGAYGLLGPGSWPQPAELQPAKRCARPSHRRPTQLPPPPPPQACWTASPLPPPLCLPF